MGTPAFTAGIPLGPFVLTEVIGRAGMGVVWQGLHVEQGLPVAVKVLTLAGSQDPLFLASLRNEVRGVAGLDHPAVVQIYDQGILPEGVSAATGGELSPGSPYLVMELLEGGTLLPLCGRMGWAQVWRVLAQVLEGLAHAHARGVIHRDIKPSNILLRRVGGGVTLVDFGLASAGDRERGGSPFLDVGTPGYMAPEQIRRQWRDIGPWTDLYAVGCVATALVSARPPFQGETAEQVLLAHVHQPVPPLDPLMEVPDGFEGWVQRLLHKSHHLRFTRAADAAHALRKLVDEADDQVEIKLGPVRAGAALMNISTTDLQPLGEITGVPLLAPEDTALMTTNLRSVLEAGPTPAPMPDLPPPLVLCDRPEVPPLRLDWREPGRVRQSLRLLGTGLGIFGLRDLPVIGRAVEQDLLWEQLCETVGLQRGRAVVLSGGAGSGRSHLARWLTQRAHEMGLASVYWLTAEAQSSVGAALAPLGHQILRTMEMDRVRTRVRVTERLRLLGSHDEGEIDAMMALLGPYSGEEDRREVEFERVKARYVLVRRLLQRRSVLRPVILVVDEAHESQSAIAFVRHLLRAQDYAPHPILVLLTVGGHGLSHETQGQLQNFAALEGVTSLELQPLAPDDREVLVREILGLEPGLAGIVARRSGGNPQFAVQLVGDWVQKGYLEVGADGFRMRPGVNPEIPADLQAMWERRLTAVLPVDREVTALELAARMGLDVDPDIWERACEALGVAPDWELVDHCLSAQLAMPGPTFRSWRFGHYLVADALVRRADFGGRSKAHHAAAAQVLKSRGLVEEAARLGRHQVGAGQLEEAVDTLLSGALGCVVRSAWTSAWALLQEREDALLALNIPQSDPRWAEGWLVRAESVRARNDLETSVAMCQKVLDACEPGSKWAVKALMGKGRVARIQGDHQTARALLEQATALYSGPDSGKVPYLVQLGILEATYGDEEKAGELYEEALLIARASGDGDEIQEVQFHRAGFFRRVGDGDSARAALLEVRDWCAANGRRERVAQCVNDLAEMDRLHGDSEAAIVGYRESLRLYEAVGARQAYVARTNLGIIAAEQGRTVEAREHLDRVVPMLQRMKLRGIEGLAHLVLALVETHEGQWAAWDARFKVGVDLLQETGFVDIDVARTFELIGEVALAAGEVQRGKRSLQLSAQHWQVLGRTKKSAHVAALLEQVGEMSPGATESR